MKKIILLIGILSIAVGCNKIEDNVAVSSKFKLYVEEIETKTVNNGISTLWNKGDRLMVYHALAGSTDYVKDGRFDITDPEKGEATPVKEVTLNDGQYDWYVFYPYASTHKVTQTASQTIGNLIGNSQKQYGNNSMAHIAGDSFPVSGIAKSVSSSESPGVKMRHITTILEIELSNKGARSFVVDNIEIIAPNPITGKFRIDYSSDTPKVTSSGDKYVQNTAKLEILDAEAIPAEGYSSFFVGAAPFSLPAEEPLIVNVTVKDGETEATQMFVYTSTTDTNFSSGRIRKLKLNFDKVF